ncbi:MAG TPA: hypothetical protein VFP12_09625 [Allosphingosinicella sp.]|nr:hypothetical protein [Allosphingosinicella sp.]
MTQVAQVSAAAGETPHELFRGFDSVSNGTLTSTAVEGEVFMVGLPVKLTIQLCQSVSELAKVLEIDSSVSVSFLKAFNATAKMKFMNSLNVTENNLTIVAYVRNGIGRFKVKEVALKPEIKPLANDEEVRKFVRARGDSFISEASQGGEYYAVYTFRTTSRTEQSSLIASLKAGGISGGLKFDAETQMKLKNFEKVTQVNWTFTQEMTGVKEIGLPKQDDMIDFARDFPKLPMNSPVTTDFVTTHYEDVPNFGDGFDKVIANRRYFVEPERGLLANLAQLRGVQEQIKRLKAIYRVYRFSDPGLDAFSPKVDADVKTIEDQVHAWKVNPTGDFVRPDLPSLAVGMPELEFEEGQAASFGSGTGENFDFMPVANAFRDRVRIASIQLAPGIVNKKYHVIRRLEVGYVSGNGDEKWTKVHGREGSAGELFTLKAGEFPLSLRIGHGGLIDSIEMHTDEDRQIKAGGPGGTIANWTREDDAVVLGFAGRSGGALDQLRIIHAKLRPATYVRPN